MSRIREVFVIFFSDRLMIADGEASRPAWGESLSTTRSGLSRKRADIARGRP